MYKKAKYFILLAIVVASSVVSAINFPDTASAATSKLYLAPKIKEDAIASAYRVGLALCTELGDLESSLGENTSAGNIASGKWFAQERTEPQVRAGYLVDKDNGQVQCRNLFSGHDVAKALGWNSNIELACGIGYTRTNGSNCVNGSGDFTKNSTNKNEIYDKIDAKRGGGFDGYNGRQYYVMAANTLITACGWKPVTNLADATADQKNSDDLETVKVVTGTGKIVDVLYRRDDNGKKAFRNDEGDFHYITENCDWMKDRMNEYAATYADYVKANQAADGDEAGPGTGSEADEEDETKSSCVITGVGWIVCPVLNFLAQIADTAFTGIEGLMQVQPLAVQGTSASYQAWAVMRDFANVAFVIAFLIIVFSQITSIGITNYGIKKMLPRLILAAVLVNVSYWICAIAIDLSNIIGSSLYDIFTGIAKSTTSDQQGGTWSGDGWASIVGSVTAGVVGAAVVYMAIGVLLPALVTVAFAIAAVFIVLSARQALIILWVVAAPLAFVAYLLPNTESLFRKWWKFGRTLLLLYAIIALLFGVSQLASAIILAAAGGNIVIQIMGGLITVVPLMATPFAIKASSGIAGRLAGYVNNPNKGPFDAARKRAEAMGNRIEGRRQIGALTGNRPKFLSGKYRREARREAVNAGVTREAQRSQGSFIADQAINDAKFQNRLAGGVNTPTIPGNNAVSNAINTQLGRLDASTAATNRAVAGAIKTRQTEDTEDIKNAEVQLRATITPGDTREMGRQLQEAIHNDDSVTARALQNILLTSGSPGISTYRQALHEMDNENTVSGTPAMDSRTMTEMRRNLLNTHGGIKASAADLTSHAASGGKIAQKSNNSSTWQMPDAELVKQKKSSIEFAIHSGAVTQEQAQRIHGNSELNQHLDQSMREAIEKLANGVPHTAALPRDPNQFQQPIRNSPPNPGPTPPAPPGPGTP